LTQTLLNPPKPPKEDKEPSVSSASGDAPFTIEELVEDWNAMAPGKGLSKVSFITKARRVQFSARIKEYPNLEDWKAAFRTIKNSPFLCGQNDRQWCADIDFFLQAKSFPKLVEGSYGKV
jgi:hypothetical protein